MRSSGILLHISSLPSPYGIGTMGKAAYNFIDFLKGAGQKYWQILPLSPTSFGDSPYQSFSTFAGNPYFIDLDILNSENLLTKDDLKNLNEQKPNIINDKGEYVDYEFIYNTKYKILKKAFSNFDLNDKKFKLFKEKNSYWLSDYSLFMTLKYLNSEKPWYKWDKKFFYKKNNTYLKNIEKHYTDDINFWCFIQYKFFEQWCKLKEYANNNGIKIIGDIPIYVAYDSVDIWRNPKNFDLDKNYKLINVAGCPPDLFSETGQMWGNPVYDWEYMKKDNYNWWIKRLKMASEIYHVIRIDHFRGFESYYSIPAEDDNAVNGKWKKGPGIDFFNTVNKEIKDIKIIAENLGFLTDDVKDLLKATGYPGMCVLEFAFDSIDEPSIYLPHNHDKNNVLYIGTHDNSTALGWLNKLNHQSLQYMMKYFDFENDQGIVWKLIRKAFSSVCDTVIIQMQDYLVLDDTARMNTPSTMENNWCWRTTPDCFSDDLKQSIKELTKIYQR